MPQTIASEEILQFLCSVFHPAAEEVRWIAAGWFSQVFSFEAGEDSYIIRLNPYEEDFQKDVFAWQHFAGPDLPIPRILQIGKFDRRYHYAISERCAGGSLNNFEDDTIRRLAPDMFHTIDVIRSIDVSGFAGWGLMSADGLGIFSSWSEYLHSLYNQKFVYDWQALARNTFLEGDVFETALAALQRLIPFCPQEKSLVHGDFGPHNLVSNGEVITGVLDWADMRLGDYLYDVAYLDYWIDDHFYVDQWRMRATSQGRVELHFDERIRCYKLFNVLNDLAVSAIESDLESYRETIERLRVILG
jgi:hygromycin-B 4-O-kinase